MASRAFPPPHTLGSGDSVVTFGVLDGLHCRDVQNTGGSINEPHTFINGDATEVVRGFRVPGARIIGQPIGRNDDAARAMLANVLKPMEGTVQRLTFKNAYNAAPIMVNVKRVPINWGRMTTSGLSQRVTWEVELTFESEIQDEPTNGALT